MKIIEIRASAMDPHRISIEDREILNRAMRQLTWRDRHAIWLRYGLRLNSQPMTLRQVGRELFVGQERARQIINRGLRQLRWHMERGNSPILPDKYILNCPQKA